MIEIKARREPWRDGVDILILDKSLSSTAVATNLKFKTLGEGEYCEPSLKLTSDAAQKLIDELWSCGLRPTEGTGSAGSLAATERHLKDMQHITFGLLRKQGVSIPSTTP